MNVGNGEAGSGRDGPLPGARTIKNRVNRSVDRVATLNCGEDRIQLVGYRDELTAGKGHTLRSAIRRS